MSQYRQTSINGDIAIDSQYTKSLPAVHLRNYVSHYWLSRSNPDKVYSILPDGKVDLVFEVCGGSVHDSLYGTTTACNELPIRIGSHYLGVCFKPGQSRHFMNVPAIELTNTCESAQGLLKFSVPDITDHITSKDLFLSLNEVLERHISKYQPAHSEIDDVVQIIESNRGVIQVTDAAALFGKSRRQFERVFQETVGVTAKLFAQIVRFHRASCLVTQSSMSLADIAVVSGYTDQSHMCHEFRRFTNLSPAAYARSHVEFLQDTSYNHLEDSLS